MPVKSPVKAVAKAAAKTPAKAAVKAPASAPAKVAAKVPAKAGAARAANAAAKPAAAAKRTAADKKAVAAVARPVPALPTRPAPGVVEANREKAKKPKLVRDSFTMPEAEYQVLVDLKKACIKSGFEVKKSELLRVGVALMQQADVARLKQILATLPALKAGRPSKAK